MTVIQEQTIEESILEPKKPQIYAKKSSIDEGTNQRLPKIELSGKELLIDCSSIRQAGSVAEPSFDINLTSSLIEPHGSSSELKS